MRADGVGLSLSYDKGEANGVWASLSGDQLTGKNVEDNWRVRWMTGYYYKVINQNNRRVTIGLNNMIWHYDKDLVATHSVRAVTTVRRNTCRLPYR